MSALLTRRGASLTLLQPLPVCEWVTALLLMVRKCQQKGHSLVAMSVSLPTHSKTRNVMVLRLGTGLQSCELTIQVGTLMKTPTRCLQGKSGHRNILAC